ncbi:MAG: methyltransferase, FxLD system [Chloroflexi bacterium]|nr:methyltransferase, FxLD system [Chloroflexota bacterium]MBV9542866.1 methyltransferase, FxLD system [Chloroflexota bacterium]
MGPASRPDTRALRRRLVEVLRADGHLHSERVSAALEAVPRELFVPGVDLEEVYRSADAIVTKRVDGVGVSSASAPNVMAIMLEQLDAQPGHRVLEIGAGTGYNAALLAHIVGPTGSVTTLDIDEDIVAAAKDHLRAAGFPTVRALVRDGALGCPERSADSALESECERTFDRIMLTVGSRDIAPAWREQLRPDGRLVLPLRIRGPQRSIAFRPEDHHLVSISVQACAFIPLRGLLAGPTVLVESGPRGTLSVTPPDDTFSLPSERIAHWLRQPRERWLTGVSATLDDIRDALHVWLVVHEPTVCMVYAEAGDSAVPDLFGTTERIRGSVGVVAPDGIALLGWATGHELYVEAAPDSAIQAERLVGVVRDWHTAGRPGDGQLQVRAYPRGQAAMPESDEAVVDERWTRFLISWRGARQPPATLTV